MKKQLFAFAFIVTMATNVIAFDQNSMYDETSQASCWTRIENQFVTKIADEKELIWNHIGASAAVVIALTAGSQLFIPGKNLDAKFSENMFSTGNVYGGTAALSAGTFAVSALECYITAQAKRNAVADFFTNWDKNKSFVPTELQDGFEIIAEAMAKNSHAVLKNAGDIVDEIQFIVIRHFEGRYKNTLDKKAYEAMNEVKTFVGIVKSIIGGSKDLGGSSK